MARRIAALLLCALSWTGPSVLGGCGNQPQDAGNTVCIDPFTGACTACPGAQVCVDPQSCVVITCGSGDISFTGQDVGAKVGDAQSDAGAVDGGQIDGAGPQDALSIDGAEGADAAGPDSQGGDVEGTDAGQSDAGPDAAGKADSTQPDAASPVCAKGAKACTDDKTPAFCFDGKWLELDPCKGGYACSKGGCVCANECLAINQTQCLDKIAAFKTCQLSDGCLSWSVALACKPGEVCVAGQCKAPDPGACNPACPQGQACQNGVCVVSGCNPACGANQYCEKNQCVPNQPGTLACSQIFACIDQFSNGPGDKVNIDACIAKGTADAQILYAKRKACIALSCQTYIDQGKANDAMLCVYTYCANEQSSCMGSGNDGCQQLAGCIVGCGTSTLCLVGCHASASVTGAKDFYALQSCASNQCPNMTGAQWVQCAEQKCKAFLDKCNASSAGSLSCAQILQCAAPCTDKPCAQACKSKGSVQGLADLDKLLTCSNTKCNAYCSSGTQAQCDACLDILCGPENAACK